MFFIHAALLIGLPTETLSTQSPAILLSRSLDRHPLPVALFAGESLSALLELVILLEVGVPALILQVFRVYLVIITFIPKRTIRIDMMV